jgi:DNA-binding NarL/FixJ family response regulator
VLDLLLAGETTKTIAERLGISVRTVKSRIAEILEVEDVSSRAELRARRSDLRSRIRVREAG